VPATPEQRRKVAMTDAPEPEGVEGVFSYRAHKDGTVRIAYRGKVVTTLAGERAARFLARVAGADAASAQQLMARATGNFKRGNERQPGRP
jgi:hypothetical protein